MGRIHAGITRLATAGHDLVVEVQADVAVTQLSLQAVELNLENALSVLARTSRETVYEVANHNPTPTSQTSNTKFQTPENLQGSSSKPPTSLEKLEFGHWDFFGAWSLVFGVFIHS